MKKVSYSPEAGQDLQNIKCYILREFGEEIAKKVLLKIIKDIQILEVYEMFIKCGKFHVISNIFIRKKITCFIELKKTI